MNLRLIGYYQLTGLIELATGLHIGRSKDEAEVGDKENPVILTALDNAPYIPGSSLKGKLRALLEWDTGVHPEGKVRGADGNYAADDPVLKIFGVPARDAASGNESILGPTRVLVADSLLAAEKDGGMWNNKPYDWQRTFREGVWQTEEKNENALNRITAASTPRPVERVPAGVQFVLNIRYRVFDLNGDGGKADRENFRWVLLGLALLEQDALGGGGSRGSGMLKFLRLKFADDKGESRGVDLADARKNRPHWIALAK